ncbi:MAG TPA: imidazolonepropionase [Nevskiaceae bacterium]|nr:imidazolonepropionase [Nevskiaceae bacterium]
MQHVELLIQNAAQLVTCASRVPKRGAAMQDVGVIEGGAMAINAGEIVALGATRDLAFEADEIIDARGKVVCPGFVDPHTHVVYAGSRVDEFERRIRGESYQQIMAADGGIASTVRATRQANAAALVRQSSQRLAQMLVLGTTTAEVKTGYGLDLANEIKMLDAIELLAGAQPIELVPTYMPAHVVPDAFRGRGDAYVDLIVEAMLPAARGRARFVDVFCERDAFDVAQSRRVLEAARGMGFAMKAHVDQFTELGGLAMALEVGATSVDHLDVTGAAGIAALARSNAIGVVIPTVSFNFGETRFANARAMLDAGAAIALTTDNNPGSAPCPSMPLAMAIACRYQKLSPAEALNASTVNAAWAIGVGDRVGSLQPGKQADVLIVDAPDYRALAYEFGGNLVQQVIKNGKLVA